jgi:transcription elongation factor GreA
MTEGGRGEGRGDDGLPTTSHDERHALLDELDLLRARRAELEAGLEVDDPPHDMGEQSEATQRRDELTWIEGRIRDIVYLLGAAARAGHALPGRVGVGSVVGLRHPDGQSERLKVTRIPDDDFPTVTPESPLGRALLGAGVGDEIEWAAPEGRLRSRVESVDVDLDVDGER